jgi:hypothetical protein
MEAASQQRLAAKTLLTGPFVPALRDNGVVGAWKALRRRYAEDIQLFASFLLIPLCFHLAV